MHDIASLAWGQICLIYYRNVRDSIVQIRYGTCLTIYQSV